MRGPTRTTPTRQEAYDQARHHHGNHRPGRVVSRRPAAREGIRRHRDRAARERAEPLADRAPARPHHAPARRPPRPTVADARDRGRPPDGVLQPGGDVVRAGQLGSADAHRRVQLAGRDACARGHPPGRSEGPALPGFVERDVRQGPRGAADRAHAVLPAQSRTACRRCSAITSRSTTARATACSRVRGSCSTTSRRAAASSSSRGR